MIQVDILKAKEIAHEKRRTARAIELASLDIQATIPTMSEQAELKRQEIRDKYKAVQDSIDKSVNVENLLKIIKNIE